jgi:ribosomal protein S18 acetylase RimI-like enzyme
VEGVQVRILGAEDAPAFRDIRLRALQEHPEAFGSAYEEEVDITVEKWAEMITVAPERVMFLGAFRDAALVGIMHLSRPPRPKQRHKAHIGAMYVISDVRGCGIGRALLEDGIQRARRMEGVEEVVLAVTVGNEAARALYISAGFDVYCRNPRFLKIGDHYYDLEWMSLRLI